MSRKFTQVAELRKAFESFANAVKPDAKLYREYADMANLARMDAFDDGVAPDGSKWDALSPKTIARKRNGSKPLKAKKGQLYRGKTRKPSPTPDKPLMDQGYLRKAVSGATNERGYVRLAQSRSLPVGGGVSISEIHDQGLGNNPKREHWAIYPKARERIEAHWKKRLESAMKAHL